MGAVCDLLAGWFAGRGASGRVAAAIARWMLILACALTLALVVRCGWAMLAGGRAGQVQGRLGDAMAGAAMGNGADAVSVVQARAVSEDSIERTVTHAQSAINAASDAAGADAAGRDGLCALAASFCPAARVQQPGAR